MVCLFQREIRCRNERKIICREGKFTKDGLFLDCLFLNSVNVLEKGLRRCGTYPFSFVWSAVTLSNKWLCSYLVKKLCILCILWSCIPASSLSSKYLHRTLCQVLMNVLSQLLGFHLFTDYGFTTSLPTAFPTNSVSWSMQQSSLKAFSPFSLPVLCNSSCFRLPDMLSLGLLLQNRK